MILRTLLRIIDEANSMLQSNETNSELQYAQLEDVFLELQEMDQLLESNRANMDK